MSNGMMKSLAFVIVLAGATFGCDRFGYREAGAAPEASDQELPGSHSPGDLDPLTARGYIDDVRLGHALDPEGKVPTERETSVFHPRDDVHLSMEVTDAPAGSEVLVSVYDATTHALVWSDRKVVKPGRSYLDFVIDDDLEPGRYETHVIIGDEVAANRPFQVVAGSA